MNKIRPKITNTIWKIMPQVLKNAVDQIALPAIEPLEDRHKPPTKTNPIVIITRAFNRLEYTIQCVDSVARQLVNSPYIHVIIDQVSDDGTEQWFNWILKLKKPFWKNIGYLRLNKNLGDWGGTVLGHCLIHEKYQRLMQLDNDYMLVSQFALENLNYALELFPGNSMVMCRRLGSGDIYGQTGGDVPLLKLSRQYKVKLNYGYSRIYHVLLAVSSYMCRRETINIAIERGCDAACKFCDSLTPRGTSYKLHDVLSQHIQGWDGSRFLQHEKYYLGSVATGKKYTRVPLAEILAQPINLIEYALPPANDPGWLKPDLQIKLIS